MKRRIASLPGRIFNSFRRDMLRKMIALFFAVLLYFYISNLIHSETREVHNVPLQLELPLGLVSQTELPDVSLRVRGDARGMGSLRPRDLLGKIRIEQAVPAEMLTIELRPEMFMAPTGLNVLEVIAPRKINVMLERVHTVKVPIRPRYNSLSNLARDYAVERVTFLPPEAQVRGPESVVKALSAIYTEPIPIDAQVTESFEYTVRLDIPPGLDGCSPEKVTARIAVGRSRTTRTFVGVPVRLTVAAGAPPVWNMDIRPSAQVELTLSGPLEKVNALRLSDLKPYLELPSATRPGDYTVPVGCYLDAPGDVEITRIEPATLTIKLTEKR